MRFGARCVVLLAALGACHSDSSPPSPPAADPADAFVWGYPLVVTERTMQLFGGLFGVNTLFHETTLANAQTRFVVSPNADTLYSIAVVDLRSEPMVLTVPDVTDRYWTYQFLDAWTGTFHYVGTRATGGKGGAFAITPPGWSGALPAGAVQVASPSPQMVLLGRYLVKDAADAANVNALTRTLAPLSSVMGTTPSPPPPAIGKPAGAPRDTGTTGGSFFDELGDALAVNPPESDGDAKLLASFASIGVRAGAHPYADANGGALLDTGASQGLARIQAANVVTNGWLVHTDVANAASDPLLRAAIAETLWGANLPEEAVYARSTIDASGQPYTGAKSYVLHFDAGALPPVDKAHGFWSITLYGPDHFFVDNAIDRFAIGDRTEGLAFNADGSLDVYVQNASPAGHESNWLPAPTGAFELTLRIYLPGDAVLSGKYAYPAVVAK